MKVGVLIDKITIGGVEKIAIEEVRYLNKAHIKADLLVLSNDYQEPTAFKELLEGVNIIHLEDRLSRLQKINFKIPFFSFFSVFHLTYPLFIPSKIDREEYDLIISHNIYTSFTAKAIQNKNNIPYRVYVHDHLTYLFKQGYSSKVKKLLLKTLLPAAKLADKSVLNSAEMVFVQGIDHFNELDSLMKDKTKKYFITPGHSLVSKVKKKDNYFLMATAWKKGKNVEALIDKIPSRSKIKFKLAGKWIHEDYRKQILDLIQKKHLQDSFEILGEVSENELNCLYQKTAAVIITSNEKGFGLPALEGAANGSTFIIPRNAGAAKEFIDKVEGFFYDYNDMKELIKLLDFFSDLKMSEKMGKEALKKVTQKFSWQAHIKVLIQNN
jgi:glycosyltransferase involved in cell wall biosynthesis